MEEEARELKLSPCVEQAEVKTLLTLGLRSNAVSAGSPWATHAVPYSQNLRMCWKISLLFHLIISHIMPLLL